MSKYCKINDIFGNEVALDVDVLREYIYGRNILGENLSKEGIEALDKFLSFISPVEFDEDYVIKHCLGVDTSGVSFILLSRNDNRPFEVKTFNSFSSEFLNKNSELFYKESIYKKDEQRVLEKDKYLSYNWVLLKKHTDGKFRKEWESEANTVNIWDHTV